MSVRTVTYTDGSPVKAGDRIRYRQAAGGILPRDDAWKYGTAVIDPTPTRVGGDLLLESDSGRRYNLLGHEIERVSA